MPRPKQIKWPRTPPTLKTERLVLRALVAKDADAYFALNSNRIVMEMYGIPRHRTRKESAELIRYLATQLRRKAFLRWGIFRRDDGRLVGDIGFWRFIEMRARAEIGAKLLPEFWGQGYVSEAMIAVLEYSFSRLNLQSVEGNAETSNAGSLRMMEAVGFERIGVIPRHIYADLAGDYVDSVLFNFEAEAWKRREKRRGSRTNRP